ncbi:MAG TPA: hypothetical protein VD867_16980 [Burkholderiales bacterium]|nr:hypothetical protein [Burkholderiales bacterium]
MNKKMKLPLLGVALLTGACVGPFAPEPRNPMTFFVTSVGLGKGADLGGLEGADRHCRTLAESVDAGGRRVWRAYLSTSGFGGGETVSARDRIGKGPWQNSKGDVVAKSVDELHGTNNLTKQTAMTEKGEIVNGRGDKPNMHDILTGSSPEGRAMAADRDTTCGNWTLSTGGSAIVGHHDRQGLDDSAPAKSWNSSHGSKGCSHDNLKATGGDARFYCFAAR